MSTRHLRSVLLFRKLTGIFNLAQHGVTGYSKEQLTLIPPGILPINSSKRSTSFESITKRNNRLTASGKYGALVDQAPEIIKDFPWGPDFEAETFIKPDFTALEVVSFATGGESIISLWD